MVVQAAAPQGFPVYQARSQAPWQKEPSSAALTTSNKLRLQKEKIVQSFLITSLPSIYMDDVEAYSARLVDDGFDSLQMLMEQLEEDDLDFMKKAHKRALLQVIQKET